MRVREKEKGRVRGKERQGSRIVGIKKEREKEEKVCFRSGSNQ